VAVIDYPLLDWVDFYLAEGGQVREPLFGSYAMSVGGPGLYSACWFGLTEQFLWRDNDWLSSHVTGIASLIAGAYLFVQQVLARSGNDRKFALPMRSTSSPIYARPWPPWQLRMKPRLWRRC